MTKKIHTVLMVLFVGLAAVGSLGIVAADHQESNAGDLWVDPSTPTDDTVTEYNESIHPTIQDAVNNASDGYHIHITPTTYEENVTLGVNNISFLSDGGDAVFVNGELNGTADENVTSVEVGDSVTFGDGVQLQDSIVGGGISIGADYNPLTAQFYGVPHALWGLLVLVVAYVGYVEFLQGRN